MSKQAQRRAVARNRLRLKERGLSRYEVRGLEADQELVRSLARRLAEGNADAATLRAEVQEKVSGAAERRGGVLAALRRSPMVGAGLRLRREVTSGRDLEL